MHQHIRPIPLFLSLLLFSGVVLFFPYSFFRSGSQVRSIIWETPRVFEWRPCAWWQENDGSLEALPEKSNGYIRVDCYGGLNQMRRDLCDGIGIARLLNATMVLPKFHVAAYWNESSDFRDIFDIDYFIERTKGFVRVIKELPDELKSKEPFKVDCSKRKGQFDYVEVVLPSLLKHQYISFAPAMSQRRDRYPLHAKAALCQGCYNALRLTKTLETKARELLDAIPKPFLSLHLRFEPDMVVFSRCTYPSLSPSSLKAIEIARNSDSVISNKKPLTGTAARQWRSRGKCPLTPQETAFILQSLGIPSNTFIYLAAGDELMEIEGFTSIYKNVYTKSSLLSHVDFDSMHGNTKAALDYYVSINSDAYVATYFGNMDKIVGALRAAKGLYKTLLLNRRAFANYSSKGLDGEDLARDLWDVHREDFVTGRGSAVPDCFCESRM
ncbi:O-fucosyltransferase family protein [Rhynchospora pubera]|uniref:O-fucosyltransferase family protein n=1 Tax=Rhynchospora pubera TaxID=906938 RepID=A0AAV8ECC5_9POAL|nr:O-fucosyltransferase family protein [Rhynchospora pubera]